MNCICFLIDFVKNSFKTRPKTRIKPAKTLEFLDVTFKKKERSIAIDKFVK